MATQFRDMYDRIQFRPALRSPALYRPGCLCLAIVYRENVHGRSNATNLR